ncbi:unknown [Alistipes sp. CAG:53]|nr:unknown [Alistipes sp. CAG:53]
MQHLELEFLAVAEFCLVEIDDVVVADSQPRGVEVELGFLLAGDADADLALLGERVLEQLQLLLVVQHGDRVRETVVDELGDILDVLRAFETVADDVAVLVDDAAVVEGVDDVDVVGRRGFQMDVVLHGLFQHEREVARLGAVAIVVRTLVVDLRHRHVEHALGAVDLLGDLRQVGDFERSSVLFDQFHQRNVVEIQLVVLDGELILREIERLFDQVDVLVFHGSFGKVFTIRPGYFAIFGRK